MSLAQGHYLRSLRRLHDAELRIEYRAAEKRSRAEYRYWRAVRPLRSAASASARHRDAAYAGYPSGYPAAAHSGYAAGYAGPGAGPGGFGGLGGLGGLGEQGCPVHPRDRHRLARAQDKFYRRCYEIEIRRQRELERVRNRREQLLGLLSELTAANAATHARRGIM